MELKGPKCYMTLYHAEFYCS